MRGDLGGDLEAAALGLAKDAHGTKRRDVRDVVAGSRVLGEEDVARHDRVLGDARPTAEAEPRRDRAFVHLRPGGEGVVLGVLVSISSVGAGAVGVTALLLLYPQQPMVRIVGSDIAHAVPLTLVAGIGHWIMGSTDWQLLGVLLIGSLPGIAIGSYFAVRVPETALRLLLAGILLVVAGRLGAEQWNSLGSNLAAVTEQAPVGAPPAQIVVPIAVGARPAN